MKTEVLKDIKAAEEEYGTTIRNAEEDRKKGLANAELEAGNLIIKANNTAEEYRKKRMADARTHAAEAHARIIREGEQGAVALRDQGKRNLERAVALLVTRFREQLHVQA
jgi:V/A-type H+-transporting ATPase subunit G/H